MTETTAITFFIRSGMNSFAVNFWPKHKAYKVFLLKEIADFRNDIEAVVISGVTGKEDMSQAEATLIVLEANTQILINKTQQK